MHIHICVYIYIYTYMYTYIKIHRKAAAFRTLVGALQDGPCWCQLVYYMLSLSILYGINISLYYRIYIYIYIYILCINII